MQKMQRSAEISIDSPDIKWEATNRRFVVLGVKYARMRLTVLGKYQNVDFMYQGYREHEGWWVYKPHSETTPAHLHDIELVMDINHDYGSN